DHVFISFAGTNEIHLENLHPATLGHVKENVLTMWPHGIDTHEYMNYHWQCRFKNNPWTSTGDDGIMQVVSPRRMIIQLFDVLGSRGCRYRTSVDTGSPSPRLVFVDKPAGRTEFFIGAFSASGDKITFIDPPGDVGERMGGLLRLSMPGKIAAEREPDDGIYIIQLRKGILGRVADVHPAPHLVKSLFMNQVLSLLHQVMGCSLVASVPLGKAGLAGLGGRKEVWVFQTEWQYS
ncbi:hypothetical protein PLICRDRAFT_114692, partial [Plicaturopsis crispa FD-325 SS-3]